jgi:hypothetical protein
MIVIGPPADAHPYCHLRYIDRAFLNGSFQQSTPVCISPFRFQEGKEINIIVQKIEQ